MKQTPLFLSCCAVLAAIAFAGCASKSAPVTTPVTPEAPPPAEPVFEVTVPLLARSGSAVSGTVAFRESAGSVAVKLALAGVTPGLHGFHVGSQHRHALGQIFNAQELGWSLWCVAQGFNNGFGKLDRQGSF